MRLAIFGIVRINFGQVAAAVSSYDNAGLQLAPPLILNAADFEFSPLSTNPVAFGTAETGYTITSSAGPISLTEPRRGTDFQAILALDFSIVPQGGELTPPDCLEQI